jgi:hypothetical protein
LTYFLKKPFFFFFWLFFYFCFLFYFFFFLLFCYCFFYNSFLFFNFFFFLVDLDAAFFFREGEAPRAFFLAVLLFDFEALFLRANVALPKMLSTGDLRTKRCGSREPRRTTALRNKAGILAIWARHFKACPANFS